MKQKFSIFLMSFMLVMQIISNGLFIPMTASATDTIVSDDVTAEQQAEANEAAEADEQAHLEKTQSFIADLFTSNEKIAIKQGIAEGQITTAKAYTEQLTELTDDETKASLQQDITLVEAFVAVNALFGDDNETIMKGLMQATIDAAQEKVNLVSEKSLSKGKAVLDEKLAEATKQLANNNKVKSKATKIANEATVAASEEKVEASVKQVVKVKAVENTVQTTAGEVDLAKYTKDVTVLPPDLTGLPEGYKFDITKSFNVKLSFELPDGLPSGTILTYKLPEGTYATAEEINLDNFFLGEGIYGNLKYEKSDNSLKITLLNNVSGASDGGVKFESWFAETISETPYTLKYPIKDSVTKDVEITFETEEPELTMEKKAKGNKQYNTDKVEYTITFQGAHEGNAIVDELPSGLTKDSFTVEKYAYNAITGKFSDKPTTDTGNWIDSGASSEYELKRTGGIGDDKYVITLNTTVPKGLVYGDGKTTSGIVETNTAKIVTGDSTSESIKEATSGTVTINYPKPYEKKMADYDVATQTITWQIYYNVNQKFLGEQTIVDTFNDGFTFKDLNVYDANVKVNETTGELEISKLDDNHPVNDIVTLPSQTTQKTVGIVGNTTQQVTLKVVDTNKPYIFEYKTVANDVVTDGQITNTAEILDVWTTDNSVSQDLTNTAGNKTTVPNGINYVDKTADWEINLNTATNAGKLTGVKITDVYEHPGSMKMTTDSVKVKVKGESKILSEFDSGAIITLTTDKETGKETGFTIEFSNGKDIEPNTKILYTTSYDLKDVGTSLKNTASIDYTSNGTSKNGIPIGYNYYDLTPEAQSDGNKAGVYNPETKEITWTVNVNYYGATITNAAFTDTIKGNQTYVKGSLAVYQASVDPITGNISPNNENDASNWGVNEQTLDDSATFTINKRGEINTPYQIVYKTKVNSGIVDAKLQLITPKEEYKNTATFSGTEITETKFENITPSGLENGGEIITKTHGGKDKGSKTKHKWTIDINKSQSTINNTIIEDTLKGDMELITDSFKLTKTDYTNFTSNTLEQSIDIKPIGTDVTTITTPTIIFNEDGKGFKLYLGDIDRGYKLTYLTNYTGDPKATENLPSNTANIIGEALVTGESSKSGKTLTATEVGYSTALAWINYKPKLAIHKIAVQKDAISEVKVADLEGVEFILYDEDNKEIAFGTTQKDGKLTFDKALSSGYYYLAEKNVSSDYTKFGQNYVGDGYKTDFVSNGDTNTLLTKTIDGYDAIRVEISADTVITDTRQVELTVKNYLETPTGCQQTFINQDGDTALQGSEYKVTDKVGNTIVENIKADSKGEIVTPTLPAGEYILVQTKAPTGYDSLAKNIEFSVDSSDCSVSPITVENNHACENFVVTFENAEDFPVYASESEFKLVDEQGNTVTSTEGTEFNELKLVDGKLTLANVPNGSYKLVQTKVPTGYKNINDISVSVNGTTCNEGFKVTIPTGDDTLACPKFDITVQDSDKQAITNNDAYEKFVANAKFELVDAKDNVVKSGDKELTALTINADGKIVLGETVVGSTDLKVDAGEYTLKQINQVIGYKQITEKVVANGTDCDAVVTVPTTTQGEPTACPDYYIQVVDKDGNALTDQTDGYEKYVAEATFKLVGSDNTEIPDVKIGADGKLSINDQDLTAPSYKLVQTNSVDGFYKLTADVTPKSDDCYAIVTINTTDSELQCSETQFIVGQGVPAGVTYVIESADKKKSYTVKTVEENGEVVLKPAEGSTIPKVLPAGEYTVTTTKVPTGYAKSPVQTVTVTDENGKDCLVPVILTVVACPDFTVSYQGPANSTAAFTLTGEGYSKEITVATDATGKAVYTLDAALKPGQYTLKQTSTPSGYRTAGDVTITVADDKCAAGITVTNTKVPVPPIVPPINPDKCENPTISVTPSTGDKPKAGTTAIVTVDGKTTVGKVDENGKVTFEGTPPTLEPGKKVTVKVDGYKETTTTISEKDCTTTITITPNDKCENPTISVITPNGDKPEKGTKVTVTVDGKTTTGTVDENGKVTFEGTPPTLEPGKKVTVKVDGYKETTSEMNEKDCDTTIVITPNDKCENPTISVTPLTGDKPEKGTKVTVTTEDGKTTTGTVNEDGTITFEPGKEPTLEPGKKVTVEVEGYEPTTTTVNDKECHTTVTITPKNACDKFEVTVEDSDGDTINTVRVTIDGKTVKTTNGTYTFDQAVAPGTKVTFEKNGYKTQTVIVGDDCQVTVTLVKKDDSEEPGTDPEDPDNGGDGEDPNDGNTPDEGPDSDDSDNDNNNNGNQNGNTDSDDNNLDNQNANNNNGNNTPGNGNNATNGTTGNKAPSTGSSLLPQTGEQVALYSLVGMLLIGAAFMLFKRNRRKA